MMTARRGMMESRQIKYIALAAVFFLVICLCRGCCDALLVASREVWTYPGSGFMAEWNI